MAFSGQGYHNTQETYQCFNNWLTTIEETIAAIQGMLFNHTQWRVIMGHEVASLQQQQNQDWVALFQHLDIRPPH